VGIDGGYIRLAGHSSRQDGWFEVIVGESLRDDGGGHSFAYVHTLEQAPADRMLAFLSQEGVSADQPVTFLSDGGDTVRRAQIDFGDCGENVLDWFHVSIRVQNLEQMIKGLPERDERPCADALIDTLHGPSGTFGMAVRTRDCSGLKAWAVSSTRTSVSRRPGCSPDWRSTSATSRTTRTLS